MIPKHRPVIVKRPPLHARVYSDALMGDPVDDPVNYYVQGSEHPIGRVTYNRETGNYRYVFIITGQKSLNTEYKTRQFAGRRLMLLIRRWFWSAAHAKVQAVDNPNPIEQIA